MELKQYLGILYRWAGLIMVCSALAGATAFAVSKAIAPVYEASVVLTVNAGSRNYDDLLVNQILAKTYESLLNKQSVLEKVIANLGLSLDPVNLARNTKAVTDPNGQLITLTVSDSDPNRAAAIANEIVKVFGEQELGQQKEYFAATKAKLDQELLRVQNEISSVQADLDAVKSSVADEAEERRLDMRLAQLRNNYTALTNSFALLQTSEPSAASTQVVEAARPPRVAIWPRPILNVGLAIIVAALISFVVAILIEHFDESMDSEEEVAARTNLPIFTSIGRYQSAEMESRLVTEADPLSPFMEAYRRLRTKIELASAVHQPRAILVTSSGPGEGKSTVVANLAATLAQSGRRVIAVDANLRNPTLHTFFPQQRGTSLHIHQRGLSTMLLKGANAGDLSSYLTKTAIAHLQVLPAGPPRPEAVDLLASDQMRDLISSLKMCADVVIFDTPPILSVPDAMALARDCDTSLLVIEAGSTSSRAVIQAKEQLAEARTSILGVVLNRVKHWSWTYYDERGQLKPYHRSRLTKRLLNPTASENDERDIKELKEVVSAARTNGE
jgi:capsular exopolysaccharide synthesis family protein